MVVIGCFFVREWIEEDDFVNHENKRKFFVELFGFVGGKVKKTVLLFIIFYQMF